MNTQNLTSLELSKELKENGYPQEGEFWWNIRTICIVANNQRHVNTIRDWKEEYVVSPLASELLKQLPNSYGLYKHHKLYQIIDYEPKKGVNVWTFSDKNVCNALAKMWIYLKKNGLLK